MAEAQLRKIDEFNVLKQRLQNIKGEYAEKLLLRLNKIENSLVENISELECIYGDYEVLYRQDLIDRLYEPEADITIIDNYKDMKPQLIHKFLRNPLKFKEKEQKKIKDRIIEERTDGNKSENLTEKEQEEFERRMMLLNAKFDQFKVNYTMEMSIDGLDAIYSDANGFDLYYSDTSNQISASIFEGSQFVDSQATGIIGIGFNGKTIVPEAIAISSSSYKTTNRGINNIEYNTENDKKNIENLIILN